MLTDTIGRDVIDDVRTSCEKTGRPTTAAEVLRALEPLAAREVDAVRRVARGRLAVATPLGPDALIDIARGVDPTVAAARELGGYYALKAERDALAQLARRPLAPAPRAADDDDDDDAARDADDDDDADHDADDDADHDTDDDDDRDDRDADHDDDEDDDDAVAAAAADAARDAGGYGRPADEDEDEDEAPAAVAARPEAVAPARPRARKPAPVQGRPGETQALMTLFAYHRDAVRVAQELSIGLSELSDRVEELGLRRSIHRMLETTTDIDVFSPEHVSMPRGEAQRAPVLRKRGAKAAAAPGPVATPAGDRQPPAARTDPVNTHGTRVYHRVEPRAEASGSADAQGRREYVREPTRKPKVAVPKLRETRPETRPEPPPAPSKLPFSELQGPGGRLVLDRFIGEEKANPRVLAAKVAERYAGPGRELHEADLRQLLAHHGLLPLFQEREVANTRFLLGFHQGARNKLANALLMNAAELGTYLSRLGLTEELERTRAERARLELGRKRMTDRLVQVLTRAPYLDDLGVLGVIDREVREHIEQLFAARQATGAAAAEEVRGELGVEPNAFAKLLKRYDLSARLGS